MTAWQFSKFQQLIINRDCALMTCTALWQKMMLVEHDRQQNYTVRTGLWYTVRTGLWLRCQSNHTASESPAKCSDLMNIWNWQHFRSRLFESSHQIPQNFTIHPLPLKTQLKNCKLLFEITTQLQLKPLNPQMTMECHSDITQWPVAEIPVRHSGVRHSGGQQ